MDYESKVLINFLYQAMSLLSLESSRSEQEELRNLSYIATDSIRDVINYLENNINK